MDHDVTMHAAPRTESIPLARRPITRRSTVRDHLGHFDGPAGCDRGDQRGRSGAVELFHRLCHRDGQGGADRAFFHARSHQPRPDAGDRLRGVLLAGDHARADVCRLHDADLDGARCTWPTPCGCIGMRSTARIFREFTWPLRRSRRPTPNSCVSCGRHSTAPGARRCPPWPFAWVALLPASMPSWR